MAVDFDRACNFRLMQWDFEQEANRRKDEAKLMAVAVASGFAGEPLKFNDEGYENLPEAP